MEKVKIEKMTFPELSYPDINFWDKEAQKINIINPEDFRKGKLLEVLGIQDSSLAGSFGITDMDEIIKRQGILKFLIENIEIARFLKSNISYDLKIPADNNQGFLEYGGSKKAHNPFWKKVIAFCKMINSANGEVPVLIKTFTNFFNVGRNLNLEEKEKRMFTKISERVSNCVILQGYIDYDWVNQKGEEKGGKITKSWTRGTRKYSFRKMWPLWKTPRWAYKKTSKWLLAGWIVQFLYWTYDSIRIRRFYDPLRIKKTPGPIISTLYDFLKHNLPYGRIGSEDLNKFNLIRLRFYYEYDEDGLKIRLASVDADYKGAPKKEEKTLKFFHKDLPGASLREELVFEIVKSSFHELNRRLYSKGIAKMIVNALDERISDIRNSISLSSIMLDKKYKWQSVSGLMHMPAFHEFYKGITEFHDFFFSKLDCLSEIAEIALAYHKKSMEWNRPVYFSEILPNGSNLVEFGSIVPIHLVGGQKSNGKIFRSSDLVPIKSTPGLKFNGQLSMFASASASGKSTFLEAATNEEYLAQSGLGSFTSDFRTNVKSCIGLVFIDRTDSSTVQALLHKQDRVWEALEKISDKSTIILFLDEVGSATQVTTRTPGRKIGGLEYGKRYLKLLKEAGEGYSIVASTQIFELADWAVDNLGSGCFHIDENRQINTGTGKDGVDHILKNLKMGRKLLEMEV